MSMNRTYQFGLLYLVKLLIDADGVADEKEIEALNAIRKQESISDDIYKDFENSIKVLTEKEVYEKSIALMNQCTREEKLKVFSTLYQLSEIDGRVHAKEIRLLLYSIQSVGITFEEVALAANSKAMIDL
jgi:uncharacterized tellurite resistance protein B-like protein